MVNCKQLLILSDEVCSVDRMREALAGAESAYALDRVAPEAFRDYFGTGRWHAVIIDHQGDTEAGEKLVSMVHSAMPELPLVVVVDELGGGDVLRLLVAGALHVVERADMNVLPVVIERVTQLVFEREQLTSERDRLTVEASERANVLEALRKELVTVKALREEHERGRLESEGRYRALIENSPDGVALARGGRVTWANTRMGALFGYQLDDLKGLPLLDLMEERERERFRKLEEDGELGVFESTGLRRSGETFPIGVSAGRSAVDGADSIVVMVRDMTEQIRARQALAMDDRRAGTELLAEGVAQNFSNIMGIVSGYAASIAESFLPNTQPHRSARKILDATRHASHLTQQLLNLAQPAEQQNRAVGSIAAAQVIRDAVEFSRSAIESHGIDIQLKHVERMPMVIGEGPKLLDVVLNLILNAVDAMPHGGRLTIACHQRFQVRRGSETGVYAIITVRDEGTGMSREQVEHAFDPFYTTKKGGNSFGLGLPVAQRQVQGWGGWIDLRSHLNRGTRVRVFLKRSDSSGRVEQEGEKKTVLIVDDSKELLAMMSAGLEGAGYGVLKAMSGDEALLLHREHKDDIALCVVDWIMPGTDGRQVLAALLERDSNSNVLMTSGFSRDYCRSKLKKGGWGFLQKPFTIDQFMGAIQSRLGAD
jgi:PAS domain S-box-containing protein